MAINDAEQNPKQGVFANMRLWRILAFVVLTITAGVVIQKLGEYIQPGFLVPRFHLPAPFEAVNVLFLGIAILVLSIEAVFVGWKESSLNQLAFKKDKSSNTDLMFLLIWISGVMIPLAILGTLGLTIFLTELAQNWLGFGLLSSTPAWIAAPVAILWWSLIQYWGHRLTHTKWLWELHKSHHSPADFTVLTAFREHPIEIALGALIQSITLAPLGLNTETLIVMQVVAGVVPLYLHSKLYKLVWLEKIGIATPAGHRLHHSIASEHHDVNFGTTLNIWDRVFGTYVKPYPGVEKIPLGVEDSVQNHNNERPYYGMWVQSILWFKRLGKEIRQLFQRKSAN